MNFYREHKKTILYFTGLFIVALSLLPYVTLGEDVWVFLHEQLDGTVLNYIYQAKYLFKDSTVTELMNGIPKTGMLLPAPFAVFLFRVFSPFEAYVILQTLVTVIAYSGMFLLLDKGTGDSRIGFLCGCLFAYLPFMPAYGLTIAGQPLLWWAFWNLYEEKKKGISLLFVWLYAGFSCFVLTGFCVCIVTFVMAVYSLYRKKWYGVIGFLLLCLTYVLTNLSLFAQVLFPDSSTGLQSHRVEMVQTGLTEYKNVFLTEFLGEDIYTPAYARWILLATVVVVLFCLLRKKAEWIVMPAALLGTILLLTVLALIWQSEWCLTTIRQIGPLAYFQADRVTWMIPPLWYLILGWDLQVLFRMGEEKEHQLFKRLLAYAEILCLCGVMAFVIYQQSFFYHQLRQMIFPDTYKIMTWNQYYAEDVMEQMDAYIENDTGKNKEQYRVVSLGMPPAAALYHGFYCLDGYSNNYPLDYKHTFRKIIEPELLRNETLRTYFDDWGNRCYLFCAESGLSPMISKYQAGTYQDLQLNTEALSDMGCEYLFSAMEIQNCEDLSLDLEGIFETEESYYKVYLYKVQ